MPVEIVMPRLSDTMESGTIARWLKKEGDEVKKGETLADVETDKATMPLESYARGRLAQVLLAEELGIDLRAVNGTGPGGRVTREDVEATARQAPAAAAISSTAPAKQPAAAAIDRPLTRIQQTIARRMVQSKTTVPHFYVTAEAEMTEAVRLREQLNAAWPDARVGYTEMIAKAAAIALQA